MNKNVVLTSSSAAVEEREDLWVHMRPLSWVKSTASPGDFLKLLFYD